MVYLNLGHNILLSYSLKMEFRQTLDNVYDTLLMKMLILNCQVLKQVAARACVLFVLLIFMVRLEQTRDSG